MIAWCQKWLSILVACLLVLVGPTAVADTNRAEAAPELMPDGLMDALRAALDQPAAGGNAYDEQKVFASDLYGDNFGSAVALSSDGNTALVGAWWDDVGANSNQGSAYVFTRSGTTWSFQQQLTASDGAVNDLFGRSVALSGETALVGAPGDDVGADTNQGSAYVFVRSGTTWTQQAQLTAADGEANDTLGFSVALSGETALLGAPEHDVGSNDYQGAAYVFVRSGTTWSLQQQLTASDGAAGDKLGYSVAISDDTALVGAKDDDVDADTDQGSAYVFVRGGTTWTQQAKLTASDGAAQDRFGTAVAVSGDTAVIGAPRDDTTTHNDQGSAYVFARSGTNWALDQKLYHSQGGNNGYFGESVAISDNSRIVVGEPGQEVGGNPGQGAARAFTIKMGNWSNTSSWMATDGADDHFGNAVAVSGDGSTALVGAPDDDIGAPYQGSATVFAYNYPFWPLQQQLTAPDDSPGDNFGYSVAISGDTALVGVYQDDVGANADQGSVYVYDRSGSEADWSIRQKLPASDGAAGDYFGCAVALAGDTALVGAHAADVGGKSNQGSAYVFTRSGSTWTQQAQLTASDGLPNDNFGIAVALAADGNTAMVGAFLDDVTFTDQGSVYVFNRGGSNWTQEQTLVAPDAAENDYFGRSVAIMGSTTVVGAPRHKVGSNTLQGAAYIFSPSWYYAAQLTASDGAAGDWFGMSVAVSANTVLVGAYAHDDGGNDDEGAAYVFTGSGSNWTEQAKLTASYGEDDDFFGRSVALEGDTALVGAYDDWVGANLDQGSAYVFSRSGSTWTEQAQLTASDGAADDLFGVAVALSGETFLVGSYRDDVGSNDNQGSAYFYELVWRVHLPVGLRDG